MATMTSPGSSVVSAAGCGWKSAWRRRPTIMQAAADLTDRRRTPSQPSLSHDLLHAIFDIDIDHPAELGMEGQPAISVPLAL